MKPGKLLLAAALGWQSLTLLTAAPAASPATTPAVTPAGSPEAPKAGLSGLVRDSRNDLPLFEAKVVVSGTSEVVLTDASGSFLLSGKPAKVTVSKDGYQEKVVELKADTANVTIKLTPAASEFDDEVYTLSSFEVVADLVEGSPARMLELKMDSVASFSGLTSADFSRLALPDAASALQRVTGVSIQEGKYAVIRGLGDRYTSTTLNGIMLPSPDPDRQAVQLDLFPSGVLDNVKATKTFVPDQPGTSSGGSIQLETKGIPEERLIRLEISSAFDTNATGNDRFLQTESRTRDAWASGSSDRNIPQSAYALPFPINNPAAKALSGQVADQLGRNMSLSRSAPDPNYGIKATYGDSFPTKGWGRIGVIANVNYSSSATFIENGTYNRLVSSGLPGQLTPGNIVASTDVSGQRRQTFEKSERERSLGGLIGLAWKPSDEHTLKYNRLHLRAATNEGYRLVGPAYNSTLGSTETFVAERLSYLERKLDVHQFNGDHKFLDDRLNLGWNYTHAEATQKEPDLRQTSAAVFGGQIETTDGVSFFDTPYRTWRDISETMDAGRADLSFKAFTKAGWDTTFKTGAVYSDSSRSYDEETMELLFPNPGDDIFTDQSGFNNLIPTGAPGSTGNVEASRENRAYHGQVEQRLFQKLRLIGGARFESNEVNTLARNIRIAGSNTGNLPNARGSFTQEDVLPSLTVIYDLTPEMNIRAAWSKTVALPSYREISQYYSRSLIGGDIEIGNPNLTNSEVENWDIGWQWNRPNGDNYAFSVFHKKIDGAIEKVQGLVIANPAFPAFSTNPFLANTTVAGGSLFSWYNNPSEVKLYGFEAEARKNLGFITERLSDWHVGTGLTYIESEAQLQPFEAFAKRSAMGRAPESTRPLVGQPGLIWNAEVGYANPDQKLEATLLFYLIGDRLNAAGLQESFDVYDLSYHTVDFVVSKGLGERWKVRFAAKNLTDSKREKGYFVDNEEVGSIPVRDSYRVGRTYSFSLSCDF